MNLCELIQRKGRQSETSYRPLPFTVFHDTI